MSDGEIDRIIAEALHSYGAGEPRPGLERRILARVAAAGPRRRTSWWWALATTGACAAVVITALSWNPNVPEPPSVAAIVAQAEPPAIALQMCIRDRPDAKSRARGISPCGTPR